MRLTKINYAVIFEALAGEILCGDQYLVKEFPDFCILCVVDGLGHGKEAMDAALIALTVVEQYAQESLNTILQKCDEALRSTRGAALTIVKIDSQYNLTYKAIGNVLGVCWQMAEDGKGYAKSLFMESGIVGLRLPQVIQEKEFKVAPGDYLILATDGIKQQFEDDVPHLASPEKIAQNIFKNYRHNKDDGLILVIQCL